MDIKNVYYLPSGRIFVVDVGDYLIECTEMRDVSVHGKEHLAVRETLDPHVIWNHLVSYEDKWLLTVSTQMGCEISCRFCDVAKLPFKGNLTSQQIEDQIRILLSNTNYVNKSKKVKIGFARMGEPAFNLDNVIDVIKRLPVISADMGKDFNWLPCFNSILPRKLQRGITGFDVMREVIKVKEENYNGFLHFQISCNSTDEDTRKHLFGGADVLSIPEIIGFINQVKITNRTITLNFIVMDNIEVDVNKLKDIGLNKDKFTVKLIPLNNTVNAQENSLTPYANYSNYEKLIALGDKFNDIGIPTVIDAIAKCEESSLCCGQLAQIYINS